MAFTRDRLVEALDIAPDAADRIIGLIRGSIDYREHPAVVEWARACYHDPRDSDNAKPECLRRAIDRELGTCGVEVIEGNYLDRYHGTIQATYCNAGDTYATTILYDCATQRYRLMSMGDFVERYERSRGIR